VTLESLGTCLQGLWPAMLYTCSRDGLPNAAYLSQVEYVDPTHVALSFQFFNKSRRNITENPHALVSVIDPDTGQGWWLRLLYRRSEESGPLFDRMSWRIEAIASYCGLKGIFKLRAADVYEVLQIEPAPEEQGVAEAAPSRAVIAPEVFTARALQDLCGRVQAADSLETLVDSILEGIEASFGFKQSLILVPTEEGDRLVTIATRGYEASGVGAEVPVGVGIAGVVAEARKPIRISGLMRGMLYALAAKRAIENPVEHPPPRIPMPGLANPESQLGVPLLVRDELVGVLCLESTAPYRFHESDKASIELLGGYLALAIQNMQWQERQADAAADAQSLRPLHAIPRARGAAHCEVTYYEGDECVFVNGEYLIRSLPARILWRLLREHAASGRTEFTNRELRLDKTLKLPDWKDNLESRLLLLRRRLEQKAPHIRLVPRGRGRFALEVDSALTLMSRG
jgi:GAF domain-containing protein